MSAEEKYTTLTTEKIPAVYEAGKTVGGKEALDEIWIKGIINTRTSFQSAFERWQLEYIRPPIKVIPIDATGAAYMFNSAKNLKIVEADYFDLSQLKSGTTTQAGIYYTFSNCDSIAEIEDIGIGAVNPVNTFSRAFYYCDNLHTIAKITSAETSKYSGTFDYCRKLENITFAGTIAYSGLNFQWSPLSHDSLMSIINALADKSADTSGTTWTVKLGDSNLAKLTTEEITSAETKGWSLT